ncbi:serine/threonine protein kinase [bacterium]|nr:serine/threonine protein kinase [bacterium]
MAQPPPAPSTVTPDPLIGQRVDDFEILERIGGDSSGEMYRARQTSLDRIVAIKVALSLSEGDARAAHLVDEAQMAASVGHPTVQAIHYVGATEDLRFAVREYVAGQSLAALLEREERLAPDVALGLMAEVAAGVAAVHDAGILLCDIQPANILVTPDGDVRLTAFGLARRLEAAGVRQKPAALLERLLYYPPEATRGKRLDVRSDLYLLGATFYHAIAGRPPFEGKTAEERALQYARKEPPPLNHLVPTAPMALCMTLHKLLRRKPDDRYQTAHDVVEALARIGAVMSKKEDTSRLPRSSTRTRRAERKEEAERAEPAAEPKQRTERPAPTKRKLKAAVVLPIAGAAVAAIVVLAMVLGGGSKGKPTQAKAAPVPARARASTPGPPAATKFRSVPTLPIPEPMPANAPAGPVHLKAAEADIRSGLTTGPAAKYEQEKDCVAFWGRPEDRVQWEFSIHKPGIYEVEVVYAADASCAGNSYTVRMSTQFLPCDVTPTGGWDTFKSERVGEVEFLRGGPFRLTVRSVQIKPGSSLMNLREIILHPKGE